MNVVEFSSCLPHGGVDSLSQGSVLVMVGGAGLAGDVELTASVLTHIYISKLSTRKSR